MSFSQAWSESSFKNALISSGEGGKPRKSKLKRRIKVRLEASLLKSSLCSLYLVLTRESISLAVDLIGV